MKGKTILLITPIIFHYHSVLEEELRKMGNKVIFFPDQPSDAFTALKRKIFPKVSKYHYEKIFKKISDEKIDCFLLINGKGITRSFVSKLRKLNPKALFITYQWDSIQRNNLDRKTNFLYFLDLFDKRYSFDYDDVKSVKELNYLPNFHTIEIQKDSTEKKHIDLLLVASYTEERYRFLKKHLNQEGLKFYHHLYMPWHHFLRTLILKRKIINTKYIKFSTISKEHLDNLYKSSFATIDIPYENQSGFTMRIMESLAFKCKVFTTNSNLKNETFYTKESICVVNENNFLEVYRNNTKKENTFIHPEIEKMHISNWIQKVFSESI